MTTLTCAPRPCASCPYRQDSPSGLWAAHEYEKLPKYDGEILDQIVNEAFGMFMCHQRDGHLCAGWVATHGAENLLALRMTRSDLDPEVFDYKTDVPVFSSGAEACEHGLRDIEKPGRKAVRLMVKLEEKGIAKGGDE